MNINFSNIVKKLAMSSTILMSLVCSFSDATVIDFDDLYYDPEHPEFYGNPVNDQYTSKGLVIDGGFLQQYASSAEGVVSSPNYLLAGIGMNLIFLEAPTLVSLYVNSWRQEAIYFEAYNESGLIDIKKTKGYAGPDDDIPYESNQFISFASTDGIKSINVYGFYGRSTAGEIDDLTFTYSVPESSPLVLLCLGLFFSLVISKRRQFSA